MPPRKSKDASAAVQAPGVDMAEVENGTPSGKGKEKDKDKGKDKDEEGISIEDLSLPRTMVQRLAKGSLPANTQIQKDAVTAMSKSATLFVNYLAESAHTHTTHASRRTIQPDDVFLALKDTEFDAFIPKLQAELKKYNEIQTGKRNEYRKKVKEGTLGVGSKIAVALGAPGTRKSDVEGLKGEASEAVTGDGGDDEEGRSKKRARLEGEDGDVSMADASALNGAKLRESSGSMAQIPQVIDDSDADDGNEGVGEQGMGSEAGDSIPSSGSETESLNQDEEEDEEGSEGGRGEEEEDEEDDEEEDSVVGAAGGGDETEEDSEGRDGSEEGGRANGSALPRTVLVAMPRGKEGR